MRTARFWGVLSVLFARELLVGSWDLTHRLWPRNGRRCQLFLCLTEGSIDLLDRFCTEAGFFSQLE